MEAEMEAERAEESLQTYEEEEMGEERKYVELVIGHWQPPESQGVVEQRGTLEPFTMDRTPPFKPNVPAISSLSTTDYLNERVPVSFVPQPKPDTLVVLASSCYSVEPNGYTTSQPISHPSRQTA